MHILLIALYTGLATVLQKAVVALLPDAFVKQQVLKALKYLSKKTTNDVDDRVVAELDAALHPGKKVDLPSAKVCKIKNCKCVCHK